MINHPNIHVHDSHNRFGFCCKLIKTVEKEGFFIGKYYRHFFTELTPKILEALKKKCQLDDINVDFAYIESGNVKLDNGKKSEYPSANIVVKYSINY